MDHENAKSVPMQRGARFVLLRSVPMQRGARFLILGIPWAVQHGLREGFRNIYKTNAFCTVLGLDVSPLLFSSLLSSPLLFSSLLFSILFSSLCPMLLLMLHDATVPSRLQACQPGSLQFCDLTSLRVASVGSAKRKQFVDFRLSE